MSDEQVVEQPVEASAQQPTEQPAHTAEQINAHGTQGDTESAPKWKFADGINGSGDVPEWFIAHKYGTVEDQAKAVYELRKKLGAKAEDAPEEYTFDYEKYAINKEDPLLKEFNPLFKEMNLPQDAYEKIVDKFATLQLAKHEEFQKGLATAWDAFGPDTKTTMHRLNTWVDNNFSADEAQIIKGFQTSPEEIRVLEKMRLGAARSAPPTANQTAVGNNYETVSSVRREMEQNWSKVKEDANYRNVMHKKLAEARAREASQ